MQWSYEGCYGPTLPYGIIHRPRLSCFEGPDGMRLSSRRRGDLRRLVSSLHVVRLLKKADYVTINLLKIACLQLEFFKVADSISVGNDIIPISIIKDDMILLRSVEYISVLLHWPTNSDAILSCDGVILNKNTVTHTPFHLRPSAPWYSLAWALK